MFGAATIDFEIQNKTADDAAIGFDIDGRTAAQHDVGHRGLGTGKLNANRTASVGSITIEDAQQSFPVTFTLTNVKFCPIRYPGGDPSTSYSPCADVRGVTGRAIVVSGPGACSLPPTYSCRDYGDLTHHLEGISADGLSTNSKDMVAWDLCQVTFQRDLARCTAIANRYQHTTDACLETIAKAMEEAIALLAQGNRDGEDYLCGLPNFYFLCGPYDHPKNKLIRQQHYSCVTQELHMGVADAHGPNQ